MQAGARLLRVDMNVSRKNWSRGMNVFMVAALALLLSGRIATAGTPPNVLFIAIDDLRPQLHCYGRDEMKTPSIDRLAQQGRQFTRHYVQVPTCGASRCAMLTGRYPSQPEHYDNNAFLTCRGKSQTRSIRFLTCFAAADIAR